MTLTMRGRALAARGHGLLAAALVLLAPAAAAAQTPNFSGAWTLDRAASVVTPPAFSGGRGGAAIDRLFITHAANDTVVVGAETNGLKAWSYVPGTTGSIPVGRDTTMEVRSWWEGRRLVAEGRRGDLAMHEEMSLSDDGMRLTIIATTTTAEGVTTNRLVYRKNRPLGACEDWATPCRDFSHRQR